MASRWSDLDLQILREGLLSEMFILFFEWWHAGNERLKEVLFCIAPRRFSSELVFSRWWMRPHEPQKHRSIVRVRRLDTTANYCFQCVVVSSLCFAEKVVS